MPTSMPPHHDDFIAEKLSEIYAHIAQADRLLREVSKRHGLPMPCEERTVKQDEPYLWWKDLRNIDMAGHLHIADFCGKCGGDMAPGVAMQQTYVTGSADFPGDKGGVTGSAGGPGKMVTCRKCTRCGWSVTA